LASGQMTPRIIAMVFAMPWVKTTLGIFTFTYAYTLAALARVETRVPELHVGVTVFLNLVSVVVFFQFVQRLSSGLRPSTMMLLVAQRAQHVILDVYPQPYDPERPQAVTSGVLPTTPGQVVEFAGPPGVVMAFSVEGLVSLAREADAIVELLPQVG